MWPDGLTFSEVFHTPIATDHAFLWWVEGKFPQSRRCKLRPNQDCWWSQWSTRGLQRPLGDEVFPARSHGEFLRMCSALRLCSHMCDACSSGFKGKSWLQRSVTSDWWLWKVKGNEEMNDKLSIPGRMLNSFFFFLTLMISRKSVLAIEVYE